MSETRRIKIKDILMPLPVRNKLGAKNLCDGDIPVYSSETQNRGIRGYCGKAEFFIDEDEDCKEQYIVFGDHTRSVNVVSENFSVMDNVKVLKAKEKNIDLKYVKYMWQSRIPVLGYARHWSEAKEVYIDIPITASGNYDLLAQRKYAEKCQQLEMMKENLLEKVDTLSENEIEIFSLNDCNYKLVPICDLFTPKGGSMKYSNKWCNSHVGDYYIYSGSTTEIFASVDEFTYDGDYLTWVIDGFAGYMMHIEGKFGITCHRGILLPKVEMNDLYLDYLKLVIEPIFRKRIRGRIGIDKKNEYTALKPTHIKNFNDSIPIPVREDGSFDFDKQKYLADRYMQIQQIKDTIINNVKEMTEIDIL